MEQLNKPLFHKETPLALKEMQPFAENKTVDLVYLENIPDHLKEFFENLQSQLQTFPEAEATTTVICYNVLSLDDPADDEGFDLALNKNKREAEHVSICT
jgi:hypothetical protein